MKECKRDSRGGERRKKRKDDWKERGWMEERGNRYKRGKFYQGGKNGEAWQLAWKIKKGGLRKQQVEKDK